MDSLVHLQLYLNSFRQTTLCKIANIQNYIVSFRTTEPLNKDHYPPTPLVPNVVFIPRFQCIQRFESVCNKSACTCTDQRERFNLFIAQLNFDPSK